MLGKSIARPLNLPLASRAYRIARWAAFALAAAYVAAVSYQMIRTFGLHTTAAVAAVKALNADAFDMAAMISEKSGVVNFEERTSRPLHVILLCGPDRPVMPEAEAALEQVRSAVELQLGQHSGQIFSDLKRAIESGEPDGHIYLRNAPMPLSLEYSDDPRGQVCMGYKRHEIDRFSAEIYYNPDPS